MVIEVVFEPNMRINSGPPKRYLSLRYRRTVLVGRLCLTLCEKGATMKILAIIPTVVNAWDGYDWNAGSFVDIEKGSLVREGEEIEIYDWGAGEYRDVEVQSIDSYGSSVEVEVYDSDSGEYRTLDMDR